MSRSTFQLRIPYFVLSPSPLPLVSTERLADKLVPTGHFSLEPPQEVDECRIADRLSQLKDAIREIRGEPKQSDSVDSSFSQLLGRISTTRVWSDNIPDEEFARYDSERLAYFDRYERYMRELVERENLVKRSIRFTVAISNSGSAPADDVDVRLHFPDGFDLRTQRDLPPPPREPKRPIEPRGKLQMLQASLALPDLAMPRMRGPDFSPPSSFRLRKTNSYEIEDHFARIKHGVTESLGELLLTFDSYAEARSFNCDYEIIAANLPEQVQGKLHFVIEKGHEGQSTEGA